MHYSGAVSREDNNPQETIALANDATKVQSQVPVNTDARLVSGQEMSPTGEFSIGQLETSETYSLDISQETGDFSLDEKKLVHESTKGKPSTRPSGPPRVGPQPRIPKTIGNYQIKRVLGRGGMGVVYLAYQASLHRDVALKMVLAGGHASEQQLERFISEARAVAHLQHPNIVQVFEVGEHDQLPYFSLEFVDGMSLDQRLDGKPLTPRDAATITEKVCRAMQYAHDRGVVHRDLKPANILLTSLGEPKVTDFGLAKQLEDGESQSTRTGTVMGTPSYMSPEQAQGLIHEVTATSDQYSLGAMLYELLTGRPPFLGTKAFDTISQVIHKEPVPPCQLQEKLPADIDTICLKALQKSPLKRYASCLEMADDLKRFLRNEPIRARPVSLPDRLWRWCRRNPTIAILSTAATALLVTTAAVSTWSYLQISAQAVVIAQERDNAKEQRDEANNQRTKALESETKAKTEEAKAQAEKEEADKQRLLADEARLQAEKNQQLAEKQASLALQNIQLVVTEIDDRLSKEPGMSKIRIGLLEVLEKKWDELDLALAGGIQGEAIPTLMAVRSKIGDAWSSLDRIKESNAQYEVVYKQAHERLVIKNRNDASRFNLALICVRWAPIRGRLTGDPADAENLLNESNTLLREILKDPRPEPGSPESYQIADVLQQSLVRLASTQIRSGDLEKAEASFQEIGSINQRVLDDITQSKEWVKSVPDIRKSSLKQYFEQNRDISQSGLANVLCRLGRVAEAIPLYEKSLETRRTSLEKMPEDLAIRDQLALQLRNFGQYMLRSDRVDDAVRLLGQSHDLAEKNLKADPTNVGYKRSFGHSLYYWGAARDQAGQANEALALFERSRAIRKQMVDATPDQANKVNLMLSFGRLGDAVEAEPLIAELSASTAKNPDLRLDLARAQTQLKKQAKEDAKRTQFTDAALASLEKSVDDGLIDPFAITSEVDLIPLRNEPRYAAVVERLRTLRAAKVSAPSK